jgi:TctA family transporter
MSKGNFLLFLTRPISAVALILAFAFLFFHSFHSYGKRKGC